MAQKNVVALNLSSLQRRAAVRDFIVFPREIVRVNYIYDYCCIMLLAHIIVYTIYTCTRQTATALTGFVVAVVSLRRSVTWRQHEWENYSAAVIWNTSAGVACRSAFRRITATAIHTFEVCVRAYMYMCMHTVRACALAIALIRL